MNGWRQRCRSAWPTSPSVSSSLDEVWRALPPASFEFALLLAIKTTNTMKRTCATLLLLSLRFQPLLLLPLFFSTTRFFLFFLCFIAFSLRFYFFGESLLLKLFFVGGHARIQAIRLLYDRLELLAAIFDPTFDSDYSCCRNLRRCASFI